MKKKKLIVAWVAGSLLLFCINAIPNAYCESNKIIYPEEIASTTLRLFYDSGSINGYVVFRNKEAKMCAVKFIEQALLIRYGSKGIKLWKKNLGFINVKDFKLLELKNRDVVFAYEIKPFIFNLPKGRKITIFLEWGRIKARCEVSNFSGD